MVTCCLDLSIFFRDVKDLGADYPNQFIFGEEGIGIMVCGMKLPHFFE